MEKKYFKTSLSSCQECCGRGMKISKSFTYFPPNKNIFCLLFFFFIFCYFLFSHTVIEIGETLEKCVALAQRSRMEQAWESALVCYRRQHTPVGSPLAFKGPGFERRVPAR